LLKLCLNDLKLLLQSIESKYSFYGLHKKGFNTYIGKFVSIANMCLYKELCLRV